MLPLFLQGQLCHLALQFFLFGLFSGLVLQILLLKAEFDHLARDLRIQFDGDDVLGLGDEAADVLQDKLLAVWILDLRFEEVVLIDRIGGDELHAVLDKNVSCVVDALEHADDGPAVGE